MDENSTKRFAEINFKKLPDHLYRWNILHAKYMIKAIEELSKTEKIDNINKLKTLAWVHDIGKIENEDNHAEISIKILEKEFKLDEIDKDCILNHGSAGKPRSNDAKIFKKADGISLFYPEIILFRFWAEAKEGASFEEIKEKIKKQFEKYVKAYSDNKIAVDLLKSKYLLFFKEN